MPDLEKTFENTDNMALKDPDSAARALAQPREHYSQDLFRHPEYILPLLKIAVRQSKYLILARQPKQSLAVANRFLHLLHSGNDSGTEKAPAEFLKRDPDTFAKLMLTMAEAHRELAQFEFMQQRITNALDVAKSLDLTILHAVALYRPLLSSNTQPHRLPDRHAEFLAHLDFHHLNDSPFRKALDCYIRIRIMGLPTEIPDFHEEINLATQTLLDWIYE